MASKTIDKSIIDEALKLVHLTLKMPQKKMWIDYDEEADVLYISQAAAVTDTEMTDDAYFKVRMVSCWIPSDASKR